jgi:hypothetical protein
LAILATSASIERTFSISNNMITKNRNRLALKTVKHLTLLKSWKIKDERILQQQFQDNRRNEEHEETENEEHIY